MVNHLYLRLTRIRNEDGRVLCVDDATGDWLWELR